MPGAGNLIASCPQYSGPSINIRDQYSANPPIRIQGNRIGTDVTGTRILNPGALGKGGIGISGGRVLVGGTGPGEGNVIGGFDAWGILVLGIRESRAVNPYVIDVKGNRIGIGADGITPVPNRIGILTGSNFAFTIGGTEPGAGNTIANNLENGVIFSEGWYGDVWHGWIARVLGNRIYGNGAQGIIRGSDGASNDSGDADYGFAFYRQNYPVINRVEVINGATRVAATSTRRVPSSA